MVLDNWILSQAFLKEFVANKSTTPATAVLAFPRFFPKAMMQLALSDRSQALDQNFQQIAQQDLCKLHEMPVIETAAWNPLKMKYDLSLVSFSRVVDSQLMAELNSLVVEAHRQYETSGDWPDTLSDRTSKACTGEQWEYEKTAEGMTIRYGGKTPWRTEEYSSWPALTYRAKKPQ